MIARQARNWKLLGTAFFDVVQKNTALNPCVFNYIRRELTPEEYAAFDDAYCEYRRPEQKGIAKYIRKKEGETVKEQRKRKEVKNRNADRRKPKRRFDGLPQDW